MKDYVQLPKKLFEKTSDYFEKMRKLLFDDGDTKKIAMWIAKGFAALAPTVFSMIIAQKSLPLSTYPFGLALIAAAKSDTLFFFIGTLIFAIFSGNIPNAVGAASILVFRFIFSRSFTDEPLSVKQKLRDKILKGKTLFCESETLRLATAALGAFTAGMFQTVIGGFTFGDLVSTCINIVLCPVLCYLYFGYFDAVEKQGFRYEAGIISLLATLIFAISNFKPLGISFSVLLAAFICFLLVKKSNPLTACMFALISILAVAPTLSPAFAVAASVAAFLYPTSKIYSLCIGSISFAALTYFIGGVETFAAFFPEFMAGTLISFAVSEKTAAELLPLFCGGTKTANVAEEIVSYKEQNSKENIRDISESFEQLSKAFFDLSDKNTRIGIFDTRRICDSVCDKYCKKCAACSLCWERDYSVTLDTLNKISAKIYKTGKVQMSDLPPEFVSRCDKAEKLISDIETENTRVIKSMLKEDKTRAFAVDYAVFARVLSEALAKNEAEYAPNIKVREELKKEFSKIGFTADSIGVYGMRCKNVYTFRIGKNAVRCKADKIKEAMEKAIGGRMEDPTFEFSDGGINMICKQAPSYEVSCSSFSFAAEKLQENGDRVTAFEGKNGYYYALVNDGMGSGRAAAKKSAAASVFLEKMLRAGNSVASGIEMLSALARADSEEGFTTLDLFEFDRISGKGSFIKSGAAPSFVKRGSKLFKIRSKTFPLGILEDVDAERTTFDCEDGDKIIILSDGVTEDIEEPLWLCEFLTTADLTSPTVAEEILAEARKHTLCKDDMTAAVITVKKIK
ncbi:MAG: SpoIIE family protein phosphatase [Clostridia bacterium]|nr:SpoIIE family protein phosphatase [Clostridia bacterium]